MYVRRHNKRVRCITIIILCLHPTLFIIIIVYVFRSGQGYEQDSRELIIQFFIMTQSVKTLLIIIDFNGVANALAIGGERTAKLAAKPREYVVMMIIL